MKRHRALAVIGILLVFSVISVSATEVTFLPETYKARDAYAALQVDYPRVKLLNENGRTTRLYGAPFGYGVSPLETAENFRLNYAGILGAEAVDLLPVTDILKEGNTQGVMYNHETDKYKFTLVYYSQYRDGIPVFNSELRLLVKNESGHPLVLASSSLHDLGDFHITDKSSMNNKSARGAALRDNPYLTDFTDEKLVIFAGYDDYVVKPRLAKVITGSNTIPEKMLYVVDAETGDILYNQDQIQHYELSGTIEGYGTNSMGSEVCGEEIPIALPYTRVTLDGVTYYTDSLGQFEATDVDASVNLNSRVAGRYFIVYQYDDDDPESEVNTTVYPPGPIDIIHNSTPSEYYTAEVNTYIAANKVRDMALHFNPSYPTIHNQTDYPIWVNRNDGYCPSNAWYSGSSINFCRSGGIGAPNTGFSSVLYHEYGHHLVNCAGSGQDQYGEGMADITSIIIQDIPGTGFGFFGNCSDPLRSCVNSMRYPCEGEAHGCASLFSGCYWDTRNLLAATDPDDYREILGALAINAVLLHTGELITPQITVDYLTLDDDDGILDNRTPHFDQINEGFSNHSMEYPEPPQFVISGYDFDDVSGGDGDGILEAGEVIDLTMTLTDNNLYVATGDLQVRVWAEDALLTFTSDTYTFGSIASGGSVDNNSGPIQLSIPVDYAPRIDTVFMEFTWTSDYGSEIDTSIIVKTIGEAAILLVDDDAGSGYETYYTNYLDDLRIPYESWELSTSGVPSSTILNQYDAVIWYTGDYRGDALPASKTSTLQDYLDGGGNLLLSGQGIAAQLDSSEPDFLNNYLKSDYVSTSMIPVLLPASGQVFPVDTIAIQGAGGASNQTVPDHVQSVNGGVPEFTWYGTSDYGAISYNGDYKLLFFSFGFEAIINGHINFKARDSILVKSLDFFGIPVPTRYPQIMNMAVENQDSLHVVDHTPQLSWNYFDADGNAPAGYQIQMNYDLGWYEDPPWDTDPVVSGDTFVVYDGPTVADGDYLNFRLRVSNGLLWSPWEYMTIRFNNIPTTPENLSPDNMITVQVNPPSFTHDNCTDTDYDQLYYDYEIYYDAALTNLALSYYGFQRQSGSMTTWTGETLLVEDSVYYWRVRASDTYETSAWSYKGDFWLNAENMVPDAFDLIEPEDGTVSEDSLPVFTWTASDDADSHDKLKYVLYYSTDETFATNLQLTNISDTTVSLSTPLTFGNTYYWKVMAYDLFDGETFSTQTFSYSYSSGYICGDANSDGSFNLADASFIINAIFFQGEQPNQAASDVNLDGMVNIADASYMINAIFFGGPAPCEPGE